MVGITRVAASGFVTLMIVTVLLWAAVSLVQPYVEALIRLWLAE